MLTEQTSVKTTLMAKLTLRYRYDPSYFDNRLTRDDFGRLSVTAETKLFSGKGGFWVQWQDVAEFGEALRRFPITANEPISVQWGFEMQEGDDLILRMEVCPADKRGNLLIKFELADDYEPQDRIRGHFVTNYPDLSRFSDEIARLMSNEVEEAVLHGQSAQPS